MPLRRRSGRERRSDHRAARGRTLHTGTAFRLRHSADQNGAEGTPAGWRAEHQAGAMRRACIGTSRRAASTATRSR